jgi:hypothetical protein
MLALILIFNILQRIAIGAIESSPEAKTNKLLNGVEEPVQNAVLEDPEDEEFDEDAYMNRGRRGRNGSNSSQNGSGSSLIQSGKNMVEPLLKFANTAPNPCPRLDQTNQNLFILLILISLLYMASYLKMFEHPQANFMLDSIQLLLAEFAVFYILVHVVCVLYAKKCISQWSGFENRIDQRVKDYRKFERLFIKDTGGRF